MAFSVGDRLGRFEILGSLGAGGMGEVYRARDPHLQRDVAIKVLPSEFSSDPVRQRRFEQEARAAGGLNHPNILAVYDVGIEAHTSYIVTEVLEGQTMAARLEGKPLPPRKAVEYARQIASGLAAAHARGVVHRDIKPGNLFITNDGLVKILDFGLAKFVGPEAEDTDTVTVTVEGLPQKAIVGSLTYMSPEQARGIRLDHRTDIFSFGVVLYEMIAGFAPFRRPTPGETMQAILYEDVPALPVSTPDVAGLERIVRHCLEKNPGERFQNVHDLVFDLDTRDGDTANETVTRRWSRAAQIAATMLLVLASAAAGAFISMQLLPEPPADLYRVRTVTNAVGLEEFAAISPDGDMVAFTQVEGQRRQIFVRFLRNSSVPLRVTTDAATNHQAPRWSPDGSTLFYFSPAGPGEVQGTIYRVPALGGSPAQRVMASIGGGDINRNGRLTCFRLGQGGIELITATLDGSDVRVITQLKALHYQYPRWSPDGQTIAYQAGDGFRWDLYAVPARVGSEPVQLTRDDKVMKGLAWLPDNSGVVFASARASSVSYLPPLTLWQVSLAGTLRQLTSPEASYEQPDLDQNGLLSATRLQIRHDIWEYPVDRVTTEVGLGRRVTRQTGQVATPAVSPDGRVAYISDQGGHANIWIAPLDGRGSPRPVTREDDPGVSIGVPAWSPDGQWIAYLSSKGNGGLKFGVWLVRPDGSENRQIRPLGLSPHWSKDSAWLYYVAESNTPIMRVNVKTGATETVRSEPARNLIGVYDNMVYYVVDRALLDGRREFDLRAGPIGDGASHLVTTLPAAQTPDWQVINPTLSPDGVRLAVPLTDGFTTNIWAISTDGQRKERITNFGDRAIFIARRVAWSIDGKSILAAVGEGDADIVLLDGLLRRHATAR